MNKSTPVANFIFKLMERAGSLFFSLIVTVVLARKIDVAEYGAVELILVFVLLGQVFVQSGLNTALVQKKDACAMDFSAAFYINFMVAGILYLLLFFTAPFIEDFYKIPSIGQYLKVCALIIFPSAYNSIQNAYMAKNFLFDVQMRCSLIAGIFAGCVGVTFAYLGFGVWAYIIYQITGAILTPLCCKLFVPWKPGKIDTFKRIVPIYKYGIKILAANLLDTLYNDISSLVIGKKFTVSDLAFYGKGKQFPQVFINIVNGSLATVAFPYFARIQDDKQKIKEMARFTIKVSCFIVLPAMLCLAGIAKPLILFLLTEKWLDSVIFLQLMCFSYMFMPIFTTVSNAMNSIGRSDIHLKLELTKKAINMIALFISVVFFKSIYAIVIGQLLAILLGILVSMFPCGILLNYKVKELIADIAWPLLTSLAMFTVIMGINHIKIYALFLLVLDVLIGGIVYIGLNCLTKNRNYAIVQNYIVKIMEKK